MLSRVRFFVTLWTVARQPSLSVAFSRQEYWSGLPFLSLGDSSRPRDRTRVSCISCTGRWILYQLPHLGSPNQLHPNTKLKSFKKSGNNVKHLAQEAINRSLQRLDLTLTLRFNDSWCRESYPEKSHLKSDTSELSLTTEVVRIKGISFTKGHYNCYVYNLSL